MLVIYKFVLPIEDEVGIEMPTKARLLHVADQGGLLCLWALVDPDFPKVQRRIGIVGTGSSGNHRAIYVGTALMSDRRLVWHVFDYGEENLQ